MTARDVYALLDVFAQHPTQLWCLTEIREFTNMPVSRIYPALARLESQGWVTCEAERSDLLECEVPTRIWYRVAPDRVALIQSADGRLSLSGLGDPAPALRGPQAAVTLASVLSVAWLFVLLWGLGAAMASDVCSPDTTAGLCDPDKQYQAVMVPVAGSLFAGMLAWVGILITRRGRVRNVAVVCCCVLYLGCLSYGLATVP